jgi:23S rRNA pseudouridine1911/1915/1917 synthase
MDKYSFKISPEEAGLRLDILLSNYSKNNRLGLSRTVIKDFILHGKISISGDRDHKPHYKVKKDEVISFDIEKKIQDEFKAEDIKLKIIYEDDDLAVIDKPSGLVVHPAPGNYEHTLVNAMKNVFKNLSDVNPGRPGIVHRLDKETSGLLVIAKNNDTHLDLARQFSEHTIKKVYVAIVKGRVEFDENVIEAPIARHAFKRKNMAVNFSDKAKEAKTYYRTLKRCKDFSFLELKPFTGRTHQLRVHLDFIGHPILGDDKYGKNNKFSRLALHAKILGFVHPKTGKAMEFNSKVPKEFEDYIHSGL